MTINVSGRDDVQRYIQGAPDRIKRILRGAGRAGGRVIATEAKAEAPADETRENIFTGVELRDDHIRVTIDVKPGWGRSLGIWAEYGTVGHYISVDASQAAGRTTRRVNTLAKTGTLVINGKPVGSTVWHPGARQAPFLRPAIDMKLPEAIRAAQAYINEHIRGGAIASGPVDGDDG